MRCLSSATVWSIDRPRMETVSEVLWWALLNLQKAQEETTVATDVGKN